VPFFLIRLTRPESKAIFPTHLHIAQADVVDFIEKTGMNNYRPVDAHKAQRIQFFQLAGLRFLQQVIFPYQIFLFAADVSRSSLFSSMNSGE